MNSRQLRQFQISRLLLYIISETQTRRFQEKKYRIVKYRTKRYQSTSFRKVFEIHHRGKKKTFEGLAEIEGVEDAEGSRILKFFLFVPLLFFLTMRYNVLCSCIASLLALKCFYGHVLSRMNHYEYATVSILLAFRDYRRARIMHMREAAHLPDFIQTFSSR